MGLKLLRNIKIYNNSRRRGVRAKINRIDKDGKRVYFEKYFSFAVFGSENKALEAAIIYRDLIEKLVKKGIPKKSRPTKAQSNSSTGVLGVSKQIVGGTKPIYTGAYRIGKKTHTKSFSIKMYGDKQAFENALKWRKDMESKHST